jgi:ferrous-iron efflux pump FieF
MSALTVEERATLLRRATLVAVSSALTLSVAKLVAWSITGSIAVLASLIDSAMDAGSSLITMLAVRWSLKPADDEHRFGHGKSEALGGLAQAALITATAVLLIVRAVERLRHPEPLVGIPAGIAVMGGSIAVTFALVTYQRSIVRQTGSGAIKADALHYASDLATNVSTIVALLFASFGVTRLDPIFAIVIAGVTLYGAVRIGLDMLRVVMDHELDAAVQEQIVAIARSHAHVLGVHDLRTRSSGQTTLIQFHLEMDGGLTLREAHDVTERVEAALQAAFPGADIVIHQEPAGITGHPGRPS